MDSHGDNSEGAAPAAALTLSGDTLYGTAEYGGSFADGTVFSINTNGSGFTVLHDFGAVGDGSAPQAGLTLSSNVLYGTTSGGTLFSLPLPSVSAPQLAIALSGGGVVLSWLATPAGFILQSTTNLAPPILWNAVSPGGTLVGGQFVVTNGLSAGSQFYRLAQ